MTRYQKPPVVLMLLILASMIVLGLTVMHIDHVKRNKEAKEKKTVPAKPSRAIGALYCKPIQTTSLSDFLCMHVVFSVHAVCFSISSMWLLIWRGQLYGSFGVACTQGGTFPVLFFTKTNEKILSCHQTGTVHKKI